MKFVFCGLSKYNRIKRNTIQSTDRLLDLLIFWFNWMQIVQYWLEGKNILVRIIVIYSYLIFYNINDIMIFIEHRLSLWKYFTESFFWDTACARIKLNSFWLVLVFKKPLILCALQQFSLSFCLSMQN